MRVIYMEEYEESVENQMEGWGSGTPNNLNTAWIKLCHT